MRINKINGIGMGLLVLMLFMIPSAVAQYESVVDSTYVYVKELDTSTFDSLKILEVIEAPGSNSLLSSISLAMFVLETSNPNDVQQMKSDPYGDYDYLTLREIKENFKYLAAVKAGIVIVAKEGDKYEKSIASIYGNTIPGLGNPLMAGAHKLVVNMADSNGDYIITREEFDEAESKIYDEVAVVGGSFETEYEAYLKLTDEEKDAFLEEILKKDEDELTDLERVILLEEMRKPLDEIMGSLPADMPSQISYKSANSDNVFVNYDYKQIVNIDGNDYYAYHQQDSDQITLETKLSDSGDSLSIIVSRGKNEDTNILGPGLVVYIDSNKKVAYYSQGLDGDVKKLTSPTDTSNSVNDAIASGKELNNYVLYLQNEATFDFLCQNYIEIKKGSESFECEGLEAGEYSVSLSWGDSTGSKPPFIYESVTVTGGTEEEYFLDTNMFTPDENFKFDKSLSSAVDLGNDLYQIETTEGVSAIYDVKGTDEGTSTPTVYVYLGDGPRTIKKYYLSYKNAPYKYNFRWLAAFNEDWPDVIKEAFITIHGDVEEEPRTISDSLFKALKDANPRDNPNSNFIYFNDMIVSNFQSQNFIYLSDANTENKKFSLHSEDSNSLNVGDKINVHVLMGDNIVWYDLVTEAETGQKPVDCHVYSGQEKLNCEIEKAKHLKDTLNKVLNFEIKEKGDEGGYYIKNDVGKLYIHTDDNTALKVGDKINAYALFDMVVGYDVVDEDVVVKERKQINEDIDSLVANIKNAGDDRDKINGILSLRVELKKLDNKERVEKILLIRPQIK